MKKLSRIVALVSTLALMVGGCSAITGKTADTPPPSTSGGLQTTKLIVAVLKNIDSVPIYIAQDRGYFKAAGLDVELVTSAKGSDSINNVIGGSVDIGQSSYPPGMTPRAKRVSDLLIVAHAVQATADNVLTVTRKDSPIKDAAGLRGKTIAVSSSGGISELAMDEQLADKGVSYKDVNYVSMEFAAMQTALERRNVDAAVIAEPFLTQALRQAGVAKLFPDFTGPTADLPWSGYFATEGTVSKYRDAIGVFQQVLNQGVADARNRETAEDALVRFVGIDPDIAKLVHMPVYPIKADAVPLQRVADLMAHFDFIPKRNPFIPGQREAELDVSKMIITPTR